MEREIEADRLDDGGRSKVVVRVANILSYAVLKILAFQDRHENKDSYDLIYCLMNFGDGPEDAGRNAAHSAIRADAQVKDALRLLSGCAGPKPEEFCRRGAGSAHQRIAL